MSTMNLFTQRIQLREFTEADWAAVYLYRSDPAVKRYDTFEPNTVEEVHEILARAVMLPVYTDERQEISFCIGGKMILPVLLVSITLSWTFPISSSPIIHGRGE